MSGRSALCRQFMDSLGLEPDSVDNLEMYSHIPPVLMEKCAALSVRPDTVKSLIQSMQGQYKPSATVNRINTSSRQCFFLRIMTYDAVLSIRNVNVFF